MKNIIFCALLIKAMFSVDFIPAQTDPSWNYLFNSYDNNTINGAGIKTEDITVAPFTISNEILNMFIYALPEGQQAQLSHPEYFPQNEADILISENAEAFVTFYSEGAGYRNTLGYYTYDGNTGRTVPTTLAQLKNDGVIIFPNSSFEGSGGKMSYGLTVSLGELSANTKIIFFIVSNGWTGNGILSTDWMFSTKSSLNLEYDENSPLQVPDHKHVALLWANVGEGDILLMGFEDILRTSYATDNDFNDVLFSFSTNPMTALTSDNGNFSQAPLETDSDNDGVSDAFDEFPNDASRVYTTHYPSVGDNASIIFEDMWPREGDYDMNDLIVDLHILQIKDNSNKIKELSIETTLIASGAFYTNGFSIQIDANIQNIQSAVFLINGVETSENMISSDNDKTIITFFTDAVKSFKEMPNYTDFSSTSGQFPLCNDLYNRYINICKNRPSVNNPVIKASIIFNEAQLLKSPPYNPFITINNGETLYTEVHLPNFLPTSLVDFSLFDTQDDASDINNNITYKTSSDRPWALLIPTSFSYPTERTNISETYIHFDDWVYSEGLLFDDWYLHDKIDGDNNKYSNDNKRYGKNGNNGSTE